MTASATAMQHFHDVDHALGDKKCRYFGEGHRAVRRVVEATGPAGSPELRARLAYPERWSVKRHASLVPHVSTIDALAIAGRIAGDYLRRECDHSEEMVRRAWIRSFEVRAGSTPVESLDDIPVQVQRMEASPSRHCPTDIVLAFDIGNMRATIAVVPSPSPPQSELTDAPSSGHRERPTANDRRAERDFWLHHSEHREHSIRSVTVDGGGYSADALARVIATEPHDPFSGLGAAYSGSVSMIDTLVIFAQLAQVLAYQVDGMSRDESSTFWMRRVHLTTVSPEQPHGMWNGVEVSVLRSRLLTLGGANWRSLALTGRTMGYSCDGDVAHALPDRGENDDDY
ncbi:AvrD family protein [Galbitalea soli]|nr:AvrD family protein [Galbitalea soli]